MSLDVGDRGRSCGLHSGGGAVSIDARVANTYRDGPDLVIELIPSAPGQIAGAESLRVVNPRWDPPPPGTLLWGGSDLLTSVGMGDVFVYGTDDFNHHLREIGDNPPPWHCKGPPFHPNCGCG